MAAPYEPSTVPVRSSLNYFTGSTKFLLQGQRNPTRRHTSPLSPWYPLTHNCYSSFTNPPSPEKYPIGPAFSRVALPTANAVPKTWLPWIRECTYMGSVFYRMKLGSFVQLPPRWPQRIASRNTFISRVICYQQPSSLPAPNSAPSHPTISTEWASSFFHASTQIFNLE